MIKKKVDDIFKKYDNKRECLIPILLDIQQTFTYISPSVINQIADKLDVAPNEIYSVASFYKFLSLKKRGEYVIRICQSVSCWMDNNYQNVLSEIQNQTHASFGQTSPDLLFTVEWTNCLGMCDQGPAMMINEKIYTQLTPKKVAKIINDYRMSDNEKK